MLAFDITPLTTGIISFVFGGGLVTAIVALYKVKPEAGQIVVSAAQGALLVQSGVLENLQKEIDRLSKEVTDLKATLALRDQLILQLQSELIKVKGNQETHDRQIQSHLTDYPPTKK